MSGHFPGMQYFTKSQWSIISLVLFKCRPFNLFNKLPVGGRSTAIKLNDGSVWVVASTPLTDSTKSKLQELGEVKCVWLLAMQIRSSRSNPFGGRYIVAANAFHNLYLKPFKEAYPSAKVIGPIDLNVKLQEQQGWQLDASEHHYICCIWVLTNKLFACSYRRFPVGNHFWFRRGGMLL